MSASFLIIISHNPQTLNELYLHGDSLPVSYTTVSSDQPQSFQQEGVKAGDVHMIRTLF